MNRIILVATVMLFAISTSATATDAVSASSPYLLDDFVGRRQCEGVFPATGKSIASTLKFEKDTASGALLKHHSDTPPNRYHTLELWDFVKSRRSVQHDCGEIRRRLSTLHPLGWSGATLV